MSPSDRELADGPVIVVRRMESRGALEGALAEKLAQTFGQASAQRPSMVMLSGGSTPKPVYDALAQRSLPRPEGLYFCYSDERLVPQTSEANNYRMSRAMLDTLGVPESHRIYVRTELAPEDAALDYERRLHERLASGAPIVLILLGMGADGHTAGLFSLGDVQRARGRLAIPVKRADGLNGVTVTPELLSQAAHVLFAVAGADKQPAMKALLARDANLVAWQAVRSGSSVEVWTEPEAYPASV